MTYKQQLIKGRKIEREHLPYYHSIQKKFKETGKCPTDKEFAEGIAKKHLQESSTYYTKLDKAGL